MDYVRTNVIDLRVDCILSRMRQLQLEPNSFERRIVKEVDKFIFRRLDELLVEDLTEAVCTLLFTLQQSTLPFVIIQDLQDLKNLGFDTKANVLSECNCSYNCPPMARLYESENEDPP